LKGESELDRWVADYALTIPNTGGGYLYFSPSYHFKSRLMTEKIVRGLKEGKRMLTIGTGLTYLERLLIRRFDIDHKNLILGDISLRGVPEELQFYQFDMLGEWPNFDCKFDYIIFPESLCSLVDIYSILQGKFKSNPSDVISKRASEVLINALENLNDDGQIRANGYGDKSRFIRGFGRVQERFDSTRLQFNGRLMIVEKWNQNTLVRHRNVFKLSSQISLKNASVA